VGGLSTIVAGAGEKGCSYKLSFKTTSLLQW